MHQTVDELIKSDAIFQYIIDTYGMPGFPSRPQGFESMCKTILEQQVSLSSARASFNKLLLLVGKIVPESIIALTDEGFKQCGISRQKSIYLRELAKAVLNGTLDFESFSRKAPDEVRSELIRVKGIGNWTIDVYLMFSLRSPDILPLGDIGIISAIKDLLALETMEQIVSYTKKWSPYRTTAAFFLWHYYLEKRGRKFPH